MHAWHLFIYPPVISLKLTALLTFKMILELFFFLKNIYIYILKLNFMALMQWPCSLKYYDLKDQALNMV